MATYSGMGDLFGSKVAKMVSDEKGVKLPWKFNIILPYDNISHKQTHMLFAKHLIPCFLQRMLDWLDWVTFSNNTGFQDVN